MRFRPSLWLSFILCSFQIALAVAGEQIPLQVSQSRNGNGSKIRGPILDDDFSAWIQETGKEWGMKGVAIAVVRKDEQGNEWVTETKGYGVADRWGNLVDEDSLFSIASNSKLFTALAVGLLTSNESLSLGWDTKIKDILPQYAWSLQDEIATSRADLVDILSHRTGMPRHDGSFGRKDSVEIFLAKQKYLRPSTEFRETLQYNNQMYTLASHIVTHLSGTPFETYVARNIFDPLGLSSTTYNITQARQSGKLTDGFVNAGKDKQRGEGRRQTFFRPIPHQYKSDLVAGAGGITSSAKDMATWLHALLLQGRSPSTNESVIPAFAIDKVAQGVTVYKPVSIFPEISPVVYGMGQYRFSYRGHELIEHAGDFPGQHSVLTRFPRDDLAIAILTNWDYGSEFRDVVRGRLLDKALGLSFIDWNERYHRIVGEAETTAAQRKIFPSHSLPSTVPYYDLAGLYFNPAYGTLSLCAYPPPKNAPSAREECDVLLSDTQSSLRSLLNESVPTLLAASPNLGCTHVLLRHFSGDLFNASTPSAFPPPFPTGSNLKDNDSLPFAVDNDAWNALFVFQKPVDGAAATLEGMSWTGGVWGAGEGIESPEGEGKEGAEVWFDRVV